MNHKIIGLLLCILVTISAFPAKETRRHKRNSVGSNNDLMDSIYTDCLRKDSVSCVKYKFLTLVDKMVDARDQFTLSEGVTVVKVPGSEGTPSSIE